MSDVKSFSELLDECLIDLTKRHDYEFNKVAHSLRKYFGFLETIYPKEACLVDPHMFTSAFCRARFGYLEYKRAQNTQPKTEKTQIEKKQTETKPVDDDSGPSDFNIFKHSLKKDFDKIIANAKKELPVIDDQKDVSDTEILHSNIPPPNEFEKKLIADTYGSDENFWKMVDKENVKSKSPPKMVDVKSKPPPTRMSRARAERLYKQSITTQSVKDLESQIEKEFLDATSQPVTMSQPTVSLNIEQTLSGIDLDALLEEVNSKKASSTRSQTTQNSHSSQNSQPSQNNHVRSSRSRHARMEVYEHSDSDEATD